MHRHVSNPVKHARAWTQFLAKREKRDKVKVKKALSICARVWSEIKCDFHSAPSIFFSGCAAAAQQPFRMVNFPIMGKNVLI